MSPHIPPIPNYIRVPEDILYDSSAPCESAVTNDGQLYHTCRRYANAYDDTVKLPFTPTAPIPGDLLHRSRAMPLTSTIVRRNRKFSDEALSGGISFDETTMSSEELKNDFNEMLRQRPSSFDLSTANLSSSAAANWSYYQRSLNNCLSVYRATLPRFHKIASHGVELEVKQVVTETTTTTGDTITVNLNPVNAEVAETPLSQSTVKKQRYLKNYIACCECYDFFNYKPNRPRVLSKFNSPWSPACGPSLKPCCNPPWLSKIQRKLPWYSETERAGTGPWLSARAWESPYQGITAEFMCRWENKAERWWMSLRFSGISILILILFISNVLVGGELYTIKNVPTIYDWFQEITTKLNSWIYEREVAYNALVITASLLIDILFLIIWSQWALIGDSMRLPISYFLLYTIRALIRYICLFPFPEGYVWRIPKINKTNIYSLVVPYQASDDFFFSGHVGCCVLAVAEHHHYRCWWGVSFSIGVTLVQFFVMIITRGHYTVDMLTGALVASWCHMIAKKFANPIDQWCGIPPRPIANNDVKVDNESSLPAVVKALTHSVSNMTMFHLPSTQPEICTSSSDKYLENSILSAV